jgi:hypothetical protein
VRLAWTDLSDTAPEVFHTIGGVQYLYPRVLTDAELPDDHLKLRTPVTAVRKDTSDGAWQVTYVPPDGNAVTERYDHVIFATSAQVASRLLDGSADVAWIRYLLSLIDYDDYDVTLSRAPPSEPINTSPELYYVSSDGYMSGSVDRILDLANTTCACACVSPPHVLTSTSCACVPPPLVLTSTSCACVSPPRCVRW